MKAVMKIVKAVRDADARTTPSFRGWPQAWARNPWTRRDSRSRHARPCGEHSRIEHDTRLAKAWMAETGPVMTETSCSWVPGSSLTRSPGMTAEAPARPG